MKHLLGPLAALLLGGVLVGLLSTPPRDVPRGPYMAPLLPILELLRVLGAGQRSLISDYFWLQTVQAAGRAGETLERERWLDTYYYADLVTDLDPKFYKVYAFAGNAVPTNLGRETYINVDEGLHMLEKGVGVFPNDWRLNFYFASGLSYYKKEHKRAAEIMARAARMEGAPGTVAEVATRLLMYEGKWDAAIAIADAAAEMEGDPDTRKVLERRRAELSSEQVMEQIDAATQAFMAREGRLPFTIDELVVRQYLPAMPVDPLEGTFYLDANGKAQSSAMVQRLDVMDYEKRRKQQYGNAQ